MYFNVTIAGSKTKTVDTETSLKSKTDLVFNQTK